MTPLVSVVIGMYNASEYLDECILSLLKQTLKDIEIICVDDASTDQTPSMLERFANADPRIKIVRQEENQGVGPARNRGISLAKGKYLSILDADDFFEPTMLEEAYKRSEKDQADICLFGVRNYDNQTQKSTQVKRYLNRSLMPKHRPFSWQENKENLFTMTIMCVWSKLFRKGFIDAHKICFPSLRNGQDEVFMMNSLAMAERITWVDNVFVNYRINLTTSLTAKRSKRSLCFMDSLMLTKKQLIDRGRFCSLERTFANHALDVAVWTRTLLNEDATKIWLSAMTTGGGWKALGIEGHSSTYFDKHSEYLAYRRYALPFLGNTVVLPIPRSSEHVDRTIDSLLAQTNREIELVCVYQKEDLVHQEMLEQYATRDVRVFPVSTTSDQLSVLYNVAFGASFGNNIFYAQAGMVYPPSMIDQILEVQQSSEADGVLAINENGVNAFFVKKSYVQEHSIIVPEIMSDGLFFTFSIARQLGIGLWTECPISFHDVLENQDRVNNGSQLQYQDVYAICKNTNKLLEQMFGWHVHDGVQEKIASLLISYVKEYQSKQSFPEGDIQSADLASQLKTKLRCLRYSYWFKRLGYSLLASLSRGKRRGKYRSKRRIASFVLHISRGIGK